MTGQLRPAFGRFIDQLRDGRKLRVLGDGLAQNSDGSGDDRQQIVEIVRDAAGQLSDRFHLLRLPDPRFGRLLLGEVATDEEMPLGRLRPCPRPVQHDGVAVPVHVAYLEAALLPAAPGRAHLLPRGLEILGMDEVDGAVSDHLVGPDAENDARARADLHEITDLVGDQDQIMRGFEDALPLLDLAAQRLLIGRRLQVQRAEQPRQLTLHRDVLGQQHDQDEARRAQAVEPSGIEAEIESGDVEDGGQCDVEQPDTHHDHQPDVDHRTQPAKPQHQKCRQADAPDAGNHDHERGRIAAAAEQDRQPVMAGRHEQGQRDDRRADRGNAREDGPARGPADPGRAALIPGEGVGQHEQRKAAVPDHVQPHGGLRAGAEQACWRKQTGKAQPVDDRGRRGEHVAAGQQQQRPGSQDCKLREQQGCGDQIIERQRGLIARDECRHRRERHAGIGNGDREQKDGDGDDRERNPAIPR